MKILKLSLVKILNFKFCGDADVWLRFFVDASSRFWRWNVIKIYVWTSDMTSRSYFGKMNSTLESAVPLAMFSSSPAIWSWSLGFGVVEGDWSRRSCNRVYVSWAKYLCFITIMNIQGNIKVLRGNFGGLYSMFLFWIIVWIPPKRTFWKKHRYQHFCWQIKAI